MEHCTSLSHSPNQDNLSGRDSTLVVTFNERLDIRDHVCDSDTTSNQNDSSIRVEAVKSSIWTFDKSPNGDGAIWRLRGFIVQAVCHSLLLMNDQRHRLRGWHLHISLKGRKLLR